ncbi:MAG: HlyD family efflux transporter periplasmic adaptor subunit [Planctomycetaceae bacterium]
MSDPSSSTPSASTGLPTPGLTAPNTGTPDSSPPGSLPMWWRGAVLVAVIAAFSAAWFTRETWWPPTRTQLDRWLAHESAERGHHDDHDDHDDHAGHDHDHGPDEGNVLPVSAQARRTLGIRIGRLERGNHERTLRLPGRVATIPGVSHREVTAHFSGLVLAVHVRQGEVVRSGAPLFDVRVVHEDAVRVQLELLESLAKKEVVAAELKRLEDLNRANPGAVPGTRILEQKYERQHLVHSIVLRKQALVLLGLPEVEIDRLIALHTGAHAEGIEDEEHFGEAPLIDRLTIHAPEGMSASPAEGPEWFVTDLPVHAGQHFDAGGLLCRLADYGRLHVEGQAYERDLAALRRASGEQWPVGLHVEQGNGERLVRQDLSIGFVGSEVDPQSRTARFYVPFVNPQATRTSADGRTYAEWELLPGQMVELRLPIERFENVLVLPAEAVVRDGLNDYVFQAVRDTFVRRPVSVRYRDEETVILRDDGGVHVGGEYALSSTAQLQLALENLARGPVEAHGHHH